MSKTGHYFLCLSLIAGLLPSIALAEGYVTKQASPFFDGPSQAAQTKGILAKGYPVQQLAHVSGWKKIRTYTNDEGWILEADLQRSWQGVMLSDRSPVYVETNINTDVIFYAQRGVVVEILQQDARGWLQVVHADGEVGYIPNEHLWQNE